MSNISCTAVDVAVKSLGLSRLVWIHPSPGAINKLLPTFESFWQNLHVTHCEFVDIFEDNGAQCANVKSVKADRLAALMSDSVWKRLDRLVPEDDGTPTVKLACIETQPAIKMHALSHVIFAALHLSKHRSLDNTSDNDEVVDLTGSSAATTSSSSTCSRRRSDLKVAFQSPKLKLHACVDPQYWGQKPARKRRPKEDESEVSTSAAAASKPSLRGKFGKFKRARMSKDDKKSAGQEYRQRKKDAVTIAQKAFRLLPDNPTNLKWRMYFNALKKKDDVGDAVCHALYMMQQQFLKQLRIKAPRKTATKKSPGASAGATAPKKKSKVTSKDTKMSVKTEPAAAANKTKIQGTKRKRAESGSDESDSDSGSDDSGSESDSDSNGSDSEGSCSNSGSSGSDGSESD